MQSANADPSARPSSDAATESASTERPRGVPRRDPARARAFRAVRGTRRRREEDGVAPGAGRPAAGGGRRARGGPRPPSRRRDPERPEDRGPRLHGLGHDLADDGARRRAARGRDHRGAALVGDAGQLPRGPRAALGRPPRRPAGRLRGLLHERRRHREPPRAGRCPPARRRAPRRRPGSRRPRGAAVAEGLRHQRRSTTSSTGPAASSASGAGRCASSPWTRRAGRTSTALERLLDEDARAGATPVAVVASAGDVNTGVVEPIDAMRRIAHARGVWLHVDGAYGGFGVLDPARRAALRRPLAGSTPSR